MNNNTTNGTFKEYNEDDILSAFCDWLLDLNYQLDRKGWKHDGDRHTARLINKAHDKGGASSASATLYTDKPANGVIHDYRTDCNTQWSFYKDFLEGKDTSAAAAYFASLPSKEEQEQKKAEREAKDKADEKTAIEAAQSFYKLHNFTPPTDHAYLKRKKVSALEGVRYSGDNEKLLIIPVFKLPDMEHVVSCQRIYPDGDKRFIEGTHPNSGGVFFIGDPADSARPVALCEGYATGATVHQLTGYTVAVCFNSGNLPKAAADIRKVYGKREYYVFADNDLFKAKRDNTKNTGIEAAHKAADAIGIDEAHIITPPDSFAEIPGCTDWNDYATSDAGADTAAKSINEQIAFARLRPDERECIKLINDIPPATIDRMHEKAALRGEGLDIGFKMYNRRGKDFDLPFGGLTLIAARTGGGKTLTLANCAARVIKKHKNSHVLFLSLEESSDDIYGRVLAAYAGGIASQRVIGDTVRNGENYGKEQLKESGYSRVLSCCDELEKQLKIIDLSDVTGISLIDTLYKYAKGHYLQHGKDAVVFIDYIQKIRPSGQATNNYQDMKDVVTKLQPLTANGLLIFAGVQMNRTAVTGGGQKNGGKDKNVNRHDSDTAEFYGVYSEQAREAADIEQAADMMLYCKVDKERRPEAVNYRLLKNRHGASDGTCSIRCNMATCAFQWETINAATFLDPESDPLEIDNTETTTSQQTGERNIANDVIGRMHKKTAR